MPDDRPDVIKMLKKEREYHLEQVKRINIALSALEGGTTIDSSGETAPRSIGWSAAIDKLFRETDEWLTLNDVRKQLSESGIPEAIDKKNRNTIYSTLIRKVNKTKTLVKDDDGRYKAKKAKIKGLFDLDTDGKKTSE